MLTSKDARRRGRDRAQTRARFMYHGSETAGLASRSLETTHVPPTHQIIQADGPRGTHCCLRRVQVWFEVLRFDFISIRGYLVTNDHVNIPPWTENLDRLSAAAVQQCWSSSTRQHLTGVDRGLVEGTQSTESFTKAGAFHPTHILGLVPENCCCSGR